MIDPESRRNKYSIELDAPPASPRPDTLLPMALKDTPFIPDDFENTSRFFGNWMFILKLSANKDELFTQSKPTFKKNITLLYKQGLVRYASW